MTSTHATPSLLALTLALSCGLLAGATPAGAAPLNWVCASGPWDSACWTDKSGQAPFGRLPQAGDQVAIVADEPANPLTVTFSGAGAPLGPLAFLEVANGQLNGQSQSVSLQVIGGLLQTSGVLVATFGQGEARMVQSGGQVLIGSDGLLLAGIAIFPFADPRGAVYELQGGQLVAGTQGFSGSHAPAVMRHSGGSNLADSVSLGAGGVGQGLYQLSGSGFLQASVVKVGDMAEGRFEQSGGTASIALLSVGVRASPSTAAFAMTGGTLLVGNAQVGDGRAGSFEQAAGSHTVTGTLSLGVNLGTTGSYALSGGTLKTRNTYVGLQGTGSFVQTGGTHQVSENLLLSAFPNASGTYQLSGGRLQVGGNLLGSGNHNTLTVAGGQLDVAGIIKVSRFQVDADATMHGQVIVGAGQVLQVASGATATFLDSVELQDGGQMSGAGRKVYAGGFSLGSGAVQALDAGSVSFAAGNRYFAEIAGPGGQHDHLGVAGSFVAGGQLVVRLLGYAPKAGDSFDLFDWGSASGQFASYSFEGAALAEGLRWDVSKLYTSGALSVSAVPELPSAWLLLAGLMAVAGRRLRLLGRGPR